MNATILLLLVLSQTDADGGAPLSWLGPGPAAQTTAAEVRLFFKVEPTTTPLVVKRGEQPVPCRTERANATSAGVAHCRVALEVGANTIVARLGSTELTGTLQREDSTGNRPVEEGFGAQPLHRREVEAVCAACHPAVSTATDASCESCHATLRARPRVHGPVAQANCVVCHATPSQSRFDVKRPIQDTCFTCHADVKTTMWTRAFRHGPAAAGRCTTCHDPHGSEQPFWLKKPAFALCTTCHTEKRSERHVVVGFVYGDSHPVQGRPHPLKPNTEFACPACHNPHAAQARFLWQFDITKREVLCRTCHDK